MFSDCPVLLEARDIVKNFGGVQALTSGNIQIFKGKICGLLGANGSGKSTISKILTGIYHPTAGHLYYKGEEIHFQNPVQAAEKRIAMIHQHLSLIPELTVWQNICLGIEDHASGGFLDNATSYAKTCELLHKFSPQINPKSRVKSLAPAEKQLVEIVKALYRNPEILILDEPTSALEQEEVKKLFAVLQQFKEHIGMIFISHRMQEVFEICDYVTIFRNGESVASLNFEVEAKDEDKIISHMIGHEPKHVEKRICGLDRSVAGLQLEVKGLNLPGKLSDINFGIHTGEILGVSGLQGQGQEELLLALSGFLPASYEQITLNSAPLRLRHTRDAIREGIVLVPGDRNLEGLFMQHSLQDNVVFTQLGIGRLKGVLNREYMGKEAQAVMQKLSVKARDKGQKVSELSGGNQQKVVLGKWLALSPKVLLLCDPAKGVDVPAKEEMYRVVKELAEQGTSVLLFASDNQELLEICDRIVVMFEGSIVQDLINEDLTDEVLVTHGLHMKGCMNE